MSIIAIPIGQLFYQENGTNLKKKRVDQFHEKKKIEDGINLLSDFFLLQEIAKLRYQVYQESWYQFELHKHNWKVKSTGGSWKSPLKLLDFSFDNFGNGSKTLRKMQYVYFLKLNCKESVSKMYLWVSKYVFGGRLLANKCMYTFFCASTFSYMCA